MSASGHDGLVRIPNRRRPPSPPTSARPLKRSTAPADLRTSVAEVGPLSWGALGGTRTPSLLIRSSMCGRPDPFRSVRDLGRVPVGCPWKSGESRCRSSVWLPAWLPAVLDAWHVVARNRTRTISLGIGAFRGFHVP